MLISDSSIENRSSFDAVNQSATQSFSNDSDADTLVMVEKLRNIFRTNDRVLFEGKWVTQSEAKDEFSTFRKQNFAISFEIMVLYALILLGAAFVMFLLFQLCY